MGEVTEKSWKVELKRKAKIMKERREVSIEMVRLLWNKDVLGIDNDLKTDKTNKNSKLIEAAGKLEMKRRVIGKWLEKRKENKLPECTIFIK